jgi:hypothetical protein
MGADVSGRSAVLRSICPPRRAPGIVRLQRHRRPEGKFVRTNYRDMYVKIYVFSPHSLIFACDALTGQHHMPK